MSYLQRAVDAAKAEWKPPRQPANPAQPAAPEAWTAEWVEFRLIEAFRLDKRMPRIERPKAPGSIGVGAAGDEPVLDDDGNVDREAEAIALATAVDDQRRILPPEHEIAMMEACFGWLRMVIETDEPCAAALQAWARRKAGGGQKRKGGNSIRAIARKMGVSHVALLVRKERAISIIVSRLNASGTPVF